VVVLGCAEGGACLGKLVAGRYGIHDRSS
jgi:hypothetical protein